MAPLTQQARHMSFMKHFEQTTPTAFGSSLTNLKLQLMTGRNFPDRLIHYKGPNTKQIKGGSYTARIWIFPALLIGVPNYVWVQCKFNGYSAENWGFGAH